jgi:hypothetical protein
MTITKEGQAKQRRREAMTDLVEAGLRAIYADDPKETHFALLVFRHEGEADATRSLVSMEILATMDKTHLHEMLRNWLRRETQ